MAGAGPLPHHVQHRPRAGEPAEQPLANPIADADAAGGHEHRPRSEAAASRGDAVVHRRQEWVELRKIHDRQRIEAV